MCSHRQADEAVEAPRFLRTVSHRRSGTTTARRCLCGVGTELTQGRGEIGLKQGRDDMAERIEIRSAALILDGVSYPMKLTEKKFSTGSIGYFLHGKADGNGMQGRGFQVSGNVVQIGSKPQ